MEQSTSGSIPNLQSDPITAGDLAPHYLGGFDPYFTGLDQFHQEDVQTQPQPQQQPFGIGWDHPVFSQRHQSVSQVPGHGIYSQPPQSWSQSPLRQPLVSPAHDFSIPSQYRQPQNYAPQSQVSYEPQYPFSQDFYPSQQLSMPDTFPQSTSMQNIQPQVSRPASYQPATHQVPISQQYAVPSRFPRELRVSYPQILLHLPLSLADQE